MSETGPIYQVIPGTNGGRVLLSVRDGEITGRVDLPTRGDLQVTLGWVRQVLAGAGELEPDAGFDVPGAAEARDLCAVLELALAMWPPVNDDDGA